MGISQIFSALLFILSANALAADGPACTLDKLTNDCKLFAPDGPQLIPLGDGTYLPNFAAMQEAAKNRSASQNYQDSMNAVDSFQYKALDINTRVAQALDEIADGKLSPRTKLFLLTGGALMGLFPKNPESVPPQIRLLWPLNDPNGKFQNVKIEEAQNAFRAIAGPKVSAELAAAMKEIPDSIDVLPQTDAQKILNTVTPERRQAVDALVVRTRQLLIEQIKAGRSEGQLAPSEVETIKKIRSIKATPPDRLLGSPICQAPVPNAYYSSTDHSINLCANFYNLPDSTIVSVIGHELGHSIDACDSQFGTFSVDPAALERLKKPNGDPIDEIAGNDERFSLFLELDALSRSPGEKAIPLELASDPAAVRYFLEKGVVKSSASGIPFDQYVFRDTYTCLKDKEGFRGISADEIKKLADDVTRSRASQRGPAYDRQKDEDKIVKAFNAFPECTSVEKASQMGEVMADYFGSKTLAAWLKDQPAPKTPEQKVAPLSFFASISCLERFDDSGTKDKDSISQTIQAALVEYSKLFDSHPVSNARLEKIFLGDASVREKLCPGSDPSKPSTCLHDPKTVSRAPIVPPGESSNAMEAK